MRDEHRDRGSAVHLATHYLDEDGEIGSMDEELHGYVNAYVDFKNEWEMEPLLSEMRLYHPLLMFAGTPDRDSIVQGKRAIVELKTGELPFWCGIQTAAQELLLQAWDTEPVRRVRLGVQLSSDGKYKVKKYESPYDVQVFRHALSIVQWKASLIK